MIKLKEIRKSYSIYKNGAKKYYKHNDLNKCLACIENAAKIEYNINEFYVDHEIEDLLSAIARHLKKSDSPQPVNPEKYVLYDCFALPNRGLTQQYLRALLSTEKQVYLIIKKRENEVSDLIKKEALSHYNLKILYIDTNKTSIDQIHELSAAIEEIAPSAAFLHMTPWDTVGNVVWNIFSNTCRFQINLTDHAFWLGTNCCDYCMEFRPYGQNLSVQYRNIELERTLILPYYPIVDKCVYEGLPLENSNTVKLFSGGSIYKIYGEEDRYLKLILKILIKHPNCIFYYAGSGNVNYIKSFIQQNNLEHRWFLIGDRKDIVEIFKHIDIYIGTYPVSGGLMTQLAAAASKPILALFNSDNQYNNIEELFINTLKKAERMLFENEEVFMERLSLLIDNEMARKKAGKYYNSLLMTESAFSCGLRHILLTHKSYYSGHRYVINNKLKRIFYLDNINILSTLFYRLNITQTMSHLNCMCFILNALKYLVAKSPEICLSGWRIASRIIFLKKDEERFL